MAACPYTTPEVRTPASAGDRGPSALREAEEEVVPFADRDGAGILQQLGGVETRRRLGSVGDGSCRVAPGRPAGDVGEPHDAAVAPLSPVAPPVGAGGRRAPGRPPATRAVTGTRQES